MQQQLGGCRKFSVNAISCGDVFSANRETEKETRVPFITDVFDQGAREILDA